MGRLGKKIQLSCTCVTGVIECLGFAGIFFGWPSLVIVLKKEEYFADLCTPQNTSNHSGLRNGDCVPQDERFALIFTISNFLTNFLIFANVLLLDRYGIMVTRLLAILLFTAGTLLIAFSTAASALLLFPALILIGVGGVFLLTTNLKAGILFGRKSSTVMSLHSGAFGSAPIVLLVVKVVYEAGFSLKAIFLFISCLSVLHVLRTVFLLPWGHIPYPLPEGFTYGVDCERLRLTAFWRKSDSANQLNVLQGAVEMRADRNERKAQASEGWTTRKQEVEHERTERLTGEAAGEHGVEGETEDENSRHSGEGAAETEGRNEAALVSEGIAEDGNELPTNRANMQPAEIPGSGVREENDASFRNSVFSWLFLTSLFWFTLTQLRLIFFIGTLNPLLGLLTDGDDTQVSRLTTAFAFTQLLNIVCASWNGLILDRHKWRGGRSKLADMQSAVLSLAITVTLTVLFSISAAIPVTKVQYLTFVLLMLDQSFMYGGSSAFLVMTFPPRHFGKLFGITSIVGALVNLLQYPLFILVNGPLQDNPLYLNIAFIALAALTYAHPVNVYLYCRRESRRRAL
ncbi:equilibrative nucleobase transporter 1-like [Mobula birostris]|uniref:equilibrative nucleobase transporter 1-like n=1 Tax=Mobula birostris TaxID=1983395 RepID=UPI003B28C591